MNLVVTGNPYNGYTTKISIKQGETVALGAQFFDAYGNAINLTDYELKAQINFPAPLLLTTGNGGITINNAAIGQVQMNISSAVSALLPLGCYYYDLFLVSENGTEIPWMCGTFAVSSTITPVP